MNPTNAMFLLTAMLGGLLCVSLFSYGWQLMLRLLDVPDTARVPQYSRRAAAQADAHLDAAALHRGVAAILQPSIVCAMPIQHGD